jgi:hypothetical protein
MFAFQGLHAGQFVGGEHPFALRRQVGRLAIQFVDVGDLGIELLVTCGCEPVADQVWLKIPLFLKAEPHVVVISAPRCHAS